MSTEAQPAGPTPPQEEPANHAFAAWVPHDLPYNAAFEDSLIASVLHNANSATGIRIIPADSNEAPVSGVSLRATDISPESLPTISETDLPIPLSDTRRKFTSSLPNVLLTHPDGYFEGGPPLDPALDTFADDFFSNHPSISTPAQLKKAVDKEIETQVEALKIRLRAREKAKEKNEALVRELKNLTEQHEMELKLHERMQADARKKKEAREARRREKQGGGNG